MMYGTKTNKVLPEMSKCGGFTLVEVLAAVLLLSVGILASMSAIQACRTLQQRMYYIPIARNVAQTAIEQARATPFSQVDSLAGTTSSSYLPSGNSVVVSVAAYPDWTEDSLKKVTVTVTWPERKTTAKIKYETLLARR